MIINYPTGYYYIDLPHHPDSGGNVTYTISNNSPPRTDLLFPKAPYGIVTQPKPDRQYTREERRSTQGELIFSVTSSHQSLTGSGSRLYEIGQILEFADSVQPTVEPMLVAAKKEIQHDTNVYDYQKLGLDENDTQTLLKASAQAQDKLTAELNKSIAARKDAEEVSTEQQKIINDINRNIAALETIIASSGPDDDIQAILNKFIAKRDEAFTARNAAIAAANAAASRAAELRDQITAISSVVK